VKVRSGRSGAAASHYYRRIDLRNIADNRCSLRGYLHLRLFDAKSREITRARNDTFKVRRVAIGPGGWAHAGVQFVNPAVFDKGSPDCRPKLAAYMLVALPHHPQVTTRLWLGFDVCTSKEHPPYASPILKGRPARAVY